GLRSDLGSTHCSTKDSFWVGRPGRLLLKSALGRTGRSPRFGVHFQRRGNVAKSLQPSHKLLWNIVLNSPNTLPSVTRIWQRGKVLRSWSASREIPRFGWDAECPDVRSHGGPWERVLV